MENPPADKIPAGAVPQAGGNKNNGYINIGPYLALPVSSQGEIQIFTEPGGQGNMPPAPEIGYGDVYKRQISGISRFCPG